MSDTPHIRTQDPVIRAQQWARRRAATLEFLNARTEVTNLREMLFRAKYFQASLWLQPGANTATLKAIAQTIKQGQEDLRWVTEALSSLQSELEALQTALYDDED